MGDVGHVITAAVALLAGIVIGLLGGAVILAGAEKQARRIALEAEGAVRRRLRSD